MADPQFKGLLAEWAKGCSAETLALLATYVAPSTIDPIDMLDRMDHGAEAFESEAIQRDADRLRTLILRRLDGAERMIAKAQELSNMRDAFPQDDGARSWEACAREILELLDA